MLRFRRMECLQKFASVTPTSTTTSIPNATSSTDQLSSNAARQHLPSGSRYPAEPTHQRRTSANRRKVRVSLTAPFSMPNLPRARALRCLSVTRGSIASQVMSNRRSSRMNGCCRFNVRFPPIADISVLSTEPLPMVSPAWMPAAMRAARTLRGRARLVARAPSNQHSVYVNCYTTFDAQDLAVCT